MLTKGAASVMNRFLQSQAWHHWLSTLVLGSSPILVAPTSWMISPPREIRAALAPVTRAAGREDDLLEGVLHVLGLLDFVVAPFEVEAQHRNAPLVHRVGVDLAVALLVGDHLAASGEVDVGAVHLAQVALELLAVAAARECVCEPPRMPAPGMPRPPPSSM